MSLTTISPAFTAAFVKAQSEMEGVKKNKNNPGFKDQTGKMIKYADLAATLEAVLPALNGNEIGLSMPLCGASDNGVGCRIVMFYGPTGEVWESEAFYMSGLETNPQKKASASTYVRRYALTSFFCLPTEDDDGNAAAQKTPKATPENVDKYLIEFKKSYPHAGQAGSDDPMEPTKASLLNKTPEELKKMFIVLPSYLARVKAAETKTE